MKAEYQALPQEDGDEAESPSPRGILSPIASFFKDDLNVLVLVWIGIVAVYVVGWWPVDFAVTSIASRDPYGGKTLSPSNVTVVPGFFIQDDPNFNETGYDALQDSFGLIDKSRNRWKKFAKHIKQLNRKADKYTTYKVIYIARHGQGYHNVAESLYGTPAWNCYWSLLGTDGNITWGPDPLLTPLGEEQAKANNVGWKRELKAGVPLPQQLYSSPMRRSASTLEITWRDILLNKKVKPIIKEAYREVIGLHTCDERSNKSVLTHTYPGWDFEPTFNEHDLLWDPIYQETAPQQTLRLRLAINELFATDPRTFISITAHSGVIAAFFRAIGHRQFSVQTGGMVPVVIKAVSYPTATYFPITKGQSATAPTCTADPVPTNIQAPVSVTVQPTWYPSCTFAGCASVTGTWPGATPAAATPTA